MNASSSKPICDTDPSRRGGIDDGWIEWSGGRCPVEIGEFVSVRLRRDPTEVYKDMIAHALDWRHTNFPSDIIAYRVVQP